MDGQANSASGEIADGASRTRPTGLIGAVDNVLRLLHLFKDRQMLRVNEVGRDMGLSRSTVHRMLATLSHHGFVEQDEFSRAYRPGPALVDIGLSVVQNMDIRALAHPALVRLCAESDETVHLGVLRGNDVLYLDSVESGQVVRTGSRIGWTLPAHATAGGKAILAELPEEELAKRYPDELLSTPTPRTLSTVTALREQLAEVRRLGYAVNNAESEADVSSVGAVIKDRHGRPRGALVITAPQSRVDAAWIVNAGAAAVRVAKELSGQLG